MQKMWLQITVASVLVGLVAGCGSGDNTRNAVRGTVMLDNQPLTEGVINFRPAPGTVSNSAGGAIRDGRFELPASGGLPPGDYLVQIEAAEERDRTTKAPSGYPLAGPAGPERMPIAIRDTDQLKVTVTSDGANSFDFKLERDTR